MIGRLIKEAREAKGLTQAELAEGAVSRSYIGAVEKGRVRPTAENLQHIAEKLGKPLSYFMPDKTELQAQKLEYMLAQARACLGLEDITQAEALYTGCTSLFDASLYPTLKGAYHELSAELERRKGALLMAITSYMRAARAYAEHGLDEEAANCTYTGALHLYKAGHLDLALAMVLEALKLSTDSAAPPSYGRRSHYLIGCCYASLGDAREAKKHFALAEEPDDNMTELGVTALIAKASCYGREGNWSMALQEAQKAMSLTERTRLEELKGEALIGASVSLVNMGEVDRADTLVRELVEGHFPPAIKRKACREVILAMADMSLVHAVAPYEEELKKLLANSSAGQGWERVKDEWALAKCAMLRNPQNVTELTRSFSQAFKSYMRYRDAGEALTFGAEILRQLGETQEAFDLLREANNILLRKSR